MDKNIKGYLMYKVGGVTLEKEYVRDITKLSESDLYVRYINFKRSVHTSSVEEVLLIFKDVILYGNIDNVNAKYDMTYSIS